jgi:N-acetylmuramoyl-L-alanine amidase
MNRVYRTVDMKLTEQTIGCVPIIIDAGHGGEDSGAIAADGTEEKEINLKIAQILEDLFRVSGFEVIMVRDEDISIYDKHCKTLRSKKVSDLHNRLKIARNNPDSVLLSIHQNASVERSYNGLQVLFSSKNALSEDLANSIQNTFFDMLKFNRKREILKAPNSIFLLRNIEVPAVIIECGFISNPEESKKLSDSDYQKNLAFCIYCGYMDYFRNLQNV